MFLGGSLCMGLAVAVAVQWVVTGSLSIVWEWFAKWPTYLLLTGVLYGAVVFTLGALLGRLWLSAILVGVAGLVLSLVDYFKTAINGTPLVLADFGLAAQVGEVAGVAGELRPPVDFWMAMIALGMCVGILILVRRLTLRTGRGRLVTFSVSLALTIGLFSTQGAQAAGAVFQVDVNTRLAAANSHDTYGLTLSLWRDCFLQAKKSPEGYSEAYMEQVLARIDEILTEDSADAPAAAVQPNIIVAQSESFYDLTRLPGLQYERDPLEHFHATIWATAPAIWRCPCCMALRSWTSVLGRTSASWRMTPMRNSTPCRSSIPRAATGRRCSMGITTACIIER